MSAIVTLVRWLRLWLACRLLGFMPVNTLLVRARRSDGSVQWDGGVIVEGRRCRPVGLPYLVEGE